MKINNGYNWISVLLITACLTACGGGGGGGGNDGNAANLNEDVSNWNEFSWDQADWK